MEKCEITAHPMRRICKKAGATRISKDATKLLAKELEEVGNRIAKEAIDYARHVGRITVKAEDIEIAARKILGK
jgi:histone H3/H4